LLRRGGAAHSLGGASGYRGGETRPRRVRAEDPGEAAMTLRTLKDVALVMNDMVGLELALAALYQACAERFPADRDFWGTIESQEEMHAKAITRLADLIAAHPQEFKCGRQFNSAAIKTILAGVASYTAQVRSGQIQRQRALFIARDIENSVLEANYCDIVSTDNVEFRKTIERIAEDTRTHKSLFAAEVAKSGA
jgi:hypothetical protein